MDNNEKEIVVKQYTTNEKIKEKGQLKMWIEERAKKVRFYGAIVLIAASIPLLKTKDNNDMATDTNVNSMVTIDNNLYNEKLSNKSAVETNLLVSTPQNNGAIFLATAKATPTPTPKPRQLKDISKAEQKKINAEIKKVGDKIDCLDDMYYAELTYVEYYLAHPTLSYEEVIIRVNMGLYKNFGEFRTFGGSGYNNFDDKYTILLNRYRTIDEKEYNKLFDTSNLKEINNTGYYMQKVPHDACEKMIKDAAKAGIKLTVTSGYITFEDQEKLYNDAVKKLGKDKASVTVEKPGYSYAQIATKVTFKVKAGSTTSKWLYSNAYKYGFAYCAPDGKASLTGYDYNPDAFNYIGAKNAKLCHDKKKPWDYIYHRYIHPGVITWGPPVIEKDEYAYVPLEKGVDMLLDIMDAEKEEQGIALTKNSNHGMHV